MHIYIGQQKQYFDKVIQLIARALIFGQVVK